MSSRYGEKVGSSRVRCTADSRAAAAVAALVERRLPLAPEVQPRRRESTGARTACKPAVPSGASHSAASACRHRQRVLVQNPQPACAAEPDRAEATVAPLRDLHGGGERVEEVQMVRRVAPGEGTQLRFFETVAGERGDEVQLVQAEAVLVVGVSTACTARSSSPSPRRDGEAAAAA